MREIRAPCRLNSQSGEELHLVLDGHYVKVIDWQDKCITSHPLLLSNLEVYDNGKTMQLIERSIDYPANSSPKASKRVPLCLELSFLGEKVVELMSKEMAVRREISNEVELELRTGKF